jgi:hypothetical protein
MDITLTNINISELTKDYIDNDEEGVYGYGKLLNIRPPYQREFVYSDKKRDAVIDTLFKGFPLNTMYWAKTNEGFEIIDGQQRTISICQFITGAFSYKGRYFHNLQDDEKENILNYELTVYICDGSNSEKLKWFETINIAGEELTKQELRNAVFSGSWVSDAKRYFSKSGCPAYNIGKAYISGNPIRQDYLETAIDWVSRHNIDDYMGKNQSKDTAEDFWGIFKDIIDWVSSNFPVKRLEMKGVNWGELYWDFRNKEIDPSSLEEEIKLLFLDEEVTNSKGIYHYVLYRSEKFLNIRNFSKIQKTKAYERQNGICAICKKHFELNEMEADHITPWSEGGKTELDNCQMLCKEDNRRKSNK